jgi:hypothetical protein
LRGWTSWSTAPVGGMGSLGFIWSLHHNACALRPFSAAWLCRCMPFPDTARLRPCMRTAPFSSLQPATSCPPRSSCPPMASEQSWRSTPLAPSTCAVSLALHVCWAVLHNSAEAGLLHSAVHDPSRCSLANAWGLQVPRRF